MVQIIKTVNKECTEQQKLIYKSYTVWKILNIYTANSQLPELMEDRQSRNKWNSKYTWYKTKFIYSV